ncbi:hypothetical protein DPEC_G00250070 [Dallia pectoralis]|uniref:Uncharacterized protein n=1 Tax=Dallia pectoralis TaxID=75939 RepID=A0ACC2FSU6_DALPE|nr:hypothetical protein DPEC_G00250070 [Dallia pectoralis]
MLLSSTAPLSPQLDGRERHPWGLHNPGEIYPTVTCWGYATAEPATGEPATGEPATATHLGPQRDTRGEDIQSLLVWMRVYPYSTCGTMSTSDSDYSIDYLASDSEDGDSALGLSPDPHAADSTRTQPSSSLPPLSSSSQSVDSPGNSGRSGDRARHLSENPTRPTGDQGLRPDGENLNDWGSGGGSGPLEPSDQNHCVSGTGEPKGCRHDALSQRRTRAFWDTTVSSHAWHHRGHDEALSPSGKSNEDRKRVHCGWETVPSEEAQKDSVFARKCTDLQCYLQPLSSILGGLRSGRYSERLSGFQESVAMDRIQRIMGVLQNPNTGERYVTVILKMEEMLHSWFPHIRPYQHPEPDLHTNNQEDHSPPPKKHKLSHVLVLPLPPSSLPDGSPPECGQHPALRPCDAPLSGSNPCYSSTHLKLVHTSPVCSSKTERALQEAPGLGKPVSRCPLRSSPNLPADHREQTQDDAVSSSTDVRGSPIDMYPQTLPHRALPRDHRQGPPSGKISSPCLERLLQSKKSIISLRNTGGNKPGGGSSWL